MNSTGVYCWGRADEGEITAPTAQNWPYLLDVTLTGSASALSCGGSGCCILVSNSIRCWGSNVSGAFGISTKGTISTVTNSFNISATTGFLTNVTEVCVRAPTVSPKTTGTACALQSGSSVWCSGGQAKTGQLGDGAQVNLTTFPIQVIGLPATFNPTALPSVSPSRTPTVSPSKTPTTSIPSISPSSSKPSVSPSTSKPSVTPSKTPSKSPTTSNPSKSPSKSPTTSIPSKTPTHRPTTLVPSNNPVVAPTSSPTNIGCLGEGLTGCNKMAEIVSIAVLGPVVCLVFFLIVF